MNKLLKYKAKCVKFELSGLEGCGWDTYSGRGLTAEEMFQLDIKDT